MNHDLTASDGRWPRFRDQALAAGFRSVDALPMRLRGTVIGALNLFHTGAGAMDDPDIKAAQAFADVATIAVLQHRAASDARTVNEQLNLALTSRVAIEQAKGMVAEYRSCSVDQAFSTLRNHTRNHNVRLADLAHRVVDRTQPLATLDQLRTGAE